MLCFKNTRRKGAYLTIASVVGIIASILALSDNLDNKIYLVNIFPNFVFSKIAMMMSIVGLIMLFFKDTRNKCALFIIASMFCSIIGTSPQVYTADIIIMFAVGVKMICSESTRRKENFLIIAAIFIFCICIGLFSFVQTDLRDLALVLIIDAVIYGVIMFVAGIIILFFKDVKEQGWTLMIIGMSLLLTSFVYIQYVNSTILEEENNYVLDHIEEFDSPQNALNYSENPSSSNADKNMQEPVKPKSEANN